MAEKVTYLGNTELKTDTATVDGKYVIVEGERYYRISNYDHMPPFFISLVSHDDHWLFVSTTGGLTAGRVDENSALFPYYTDDKIEQSAAYTGPATIIRVKGDNGDYLWEPFSRKYGGIYKTSRNVYKNFTGNRIIFEEINHDLQLRYSYSWTFSEKYGTIKKSEINNLAGNGANIEILDGLQNILPYGVPADLQNSTGNLVNAYKRNELHRDSGLGIFTLNAMITDKAEPAEALKATTVWIAGLNALNILLSSKQMDQFRQGRQVVTEAETRAKPGAYLVHSSFSLLSGEGKSWYMVAEVNMDHSGVIKLINRLTTDREQLLIDMESDIAQGTKSLKKLTGMADGLQLTADEMSVGRHYSNVLFNIMRGGIFEDQYMVNKDDFLQFVNSANKKLASSKPVFFEELDDEIDYHELVSAAKRNGDPDLIRICLEYLPLSFSRRHGDPSRPWNRFSIRIKNDHGQRIKNYEGNWRDIFQNWEALAFSFPGFLQSMITKFVNATTTDGYNPYRITRDGIDWEVPDPDDPWSHIGYWGDHQIIYLLKLMEMAGRFNPEEFSALLQKNVFVYANVPYRIKSYEEIVNNPKDTIRFDAAEEKKILEKVNRLGSDGKIVRQSGDGPLRTNLAEKILVPLLAKLTNFIPEAGIWLNTQRPEWNDANNALVGNGTSMVTLYYMRRYVQFCRSLFRQSPETKYELHLPVTNLLKDIQELFDENHHLLKKNLSDIHRKKITGKLGLLGESYRREAYEVFDGECTIVTGFELADFFNITLHWIDHSIKAGKRPDGLYHAYNLITFTENGITVEPLYEMLEGQVAILSSGALSPKEAVAVLDALKNSKMYRASQYSYMLYPDRELPGFLEKNHVPESFIKQSKLAKQMLGAGNTSILKKDENGRYHFNGTFHNAGDLKAALDKLKDTEWSEMAEKEYDLYLDMFEQVFDHRAFTGRSGTFFGYEGLGSIYWHMVSKLLLAVEENLFQARDQHADAETLGKLTDHYYEIRAGIGINKQPDLYGAFPTDPYSHTPRHKGAQQPGMTGQVKEDVLNRWAELGIQVKNGAVYFDPFFLNEDEFMTKSETFSFFDVQGNSSEIELNPGELAFTFCQVPVIYRKSEQNEVTIHFRNGSTKQFSGKEIGTGLSAEIFQRTGRIRMISVETGSL